MKPKYPRDGSMVWIWYGNGPTPVTYLGRSGCWTRWRQGERQWKHRGVIPWFDNPTNCAWHEFSQRVLHAGMLEKVFGNPQRRVEDAFSAACVYVRAFSDQFKVPASEAWTCPNGAQAIKEAGL